MRDLIIEDARDPSYLDCFHRGPFLRQQPAEGRVDVGIEVMRRLVADLDIDRAALNELYLFDPR